MKKFIYTIAASFLFITSYAQQEQIQSLDQEEVLTIQKIEVNVPVTEPIEEVIEAVEPEAVVAPVIAKKKVATPAVKTAKKGTFKQRLATKILKKQLKKQNAASGWSDLDKNIRLGIILWAAAIVLMFIPVIGWILGPIVGLAGTVFIIIGLINMFS